MARAATGAMLAMLAALALCSSAYAHQGDPDFRSEINSIEPAIPGLEVEVLNYDDSLELRSSGEREVVVLGYSDEPYLRFRADGTVQVNTRSPAYYLNDDRYGAVDVPPVADAEAAPEWKTVAEDGRYAWHDHRSHYMGKGTPEQVNDESERTKVFDYEVPLEVDGAQASIDGSLYWSARSDGFPLLPFLALGLVLLGAIAALVVRRRRGGGAKGGEAW